MSEDKQELSLIEKGKNLSSFAWELLKYMHNHHEMVLFASDEIYKKRTSICKSCDKFDDLESTCMQCGCFVPAKARIIVDSCPLKKWDVYDNDWEDRFKSVSREISLQKMEENLDLDKQPKSE